MMVEFNKSHVLAVVASLCIPVLLMAGEYTLEECQSKAAEGSAEAQWQLGQRYENGDGVRKNNMRALAQYKKAAEQRHRKACARLADLYENGTYVRKDPALAAKYKAWSMGENAVLAVAQARTSSEKTKEDEIETALDYILGRNGKAKDPKAGIRILYQSAKDKPIAQRVFVERWSRGDLDEALAVLSDEEWEKILPWYKQAWDNGNKRVGLVLGNTAYSQKQYAQAVWYWQESGLAKSWYFVGRFYAAWSEEGKGGGPRRMKDETKSRQAYEKCLRIDRMWDEARYDLGCIYLFAKSSKNVNLPEALRIFTYFLKRKPNDKWCNYYYGLAGFWNLRAQFNDKWPQRKVDDLLAMAKQGFPRGRIESDGYLWQYKNMIQDWEQMKHNQEKYLVYIQKAADSGCEPARDFIQKQNQKD